MLLLLYVKNINSSLITERFEDDIEAMTNRKISWYFKICWRFISPLIIVVIMVVTLYSMFSESPQYTAWDTEKVITMTK